MSQPPLSREDLEALAAEHGIRIDDLWPALERMHRRRRLRSETPATPDQEPTHADPDHRDHA